MKKIKSILVLLIVIIFTGTVFASSKYDVISNDSVNIAKLNKMYTSVENQTILCDYLNLLISKNSLLKLVKENKFDKDKSDFLLKNPDLMVKMMHIGLISGFIGKLDKKTLNTQLIYVVGVIKDKHAQLAKNGVEYEQEKGFMRNMPLYAFWEKFQNPENKIKMINSMLDNMIK